MNNTNSQHSVCLPPWVCIITAKPGPENPQQELLQRCVAVYLWTDRFKRKEKL